MASFMAKRIATGKLTWEEVNNLNLPDEVKEEIKNILHDKYRIEVE